MINIFILNKNHYNRYKNWTAPDRTTPTTAVATTITATTATYLWSWVTSVWPSRSTSLFSKSAAVRCTWRPRCSPTSRTASKSTCGVWASSPTFSSAVLRHFKGIFNSSLFLHNGKFLELRCSKKVQKAHFYVFRWEEELLLKCRSIAAIVLTWKYKRKISKLMLAITTMLKIYSHVFIFHQNRRIKCAFLAPSFLKPTILKSLEKNEMNWPRQSLKNVSNS